MVVALYTGIKLLAQIPVCKYWALITYQNMTQFHSDQNLLPIANASYLTFTFCSSMRESRECVRLRPKLPLQLQMWSLQITGISGIAGTTLPLTHTVLISVSPCQQFQVLPSCHALQAKNSLKDDLLGLPHQLLVKQSHLDCTVQICSAHRYLSASLPGVM